MLIVHPMGNIHVCVMHFRNRRAMKKKNLSKFLNLVIHSIQLLANPITSSNAVMFIGRLIPKVTN